MIKDNIQRLVANAKIEQAIDEFINWASANDDDINNSLILIKGQYSALKRQENLGLMSFSDASRDRARIANSILELSNQITEGERKENIKLATQAQFFNAQEEQKNTITTSNKILFLASNPVDTSKLDLEKEFVQISRKMQDTEYKVVSEWTLTPGELQEAVLEHRPRIIHFSGHGMGKKTDGTRAIGHANTQEAVEPTGIVLQDSSGKSKLVSGRAIASLFGICLEEFKIDVVVLNACYSEEQAKAIYEAGVPYVIGMNRAINDDTAIEFSTGFYRGIASLNDIRRAYRLAVNAVELEGLSGDDIPVLYKKD